MKVLLHTLSGLLRLLELFFLEGKKKNLNGQFGCYLFIKQAE